MEILSNQRLRRLAQWLAGEIEQISVAQGFAPYRQRILHHVSHQDQLQGRYLALKDPRAFAGSGTEPER